MKKRSVTFQIIHIAAFLISLSAFELKADPRPILAAVVQQLQTGSPNSGWYGPVLWSTIAAQTGGSGYYPSLAALGPVTTIDVVGSQALPYGAIFQLVAHHNSGASSSWFMGIGAASNRIEYMNFNIGASLPSQPIPNPTPTPTPNPPTPTTPSSSGGACSLYPDLC